jgi:hypothetical protein
MVYAYWHKGNQTFHVKSGNKVISEAALLYMKDATIIRRKHGTVVKGLICPRPKNPAKFAEIEEADETADEVLLYNGRVFKR